MKIYNILLSGLLYFLAFNTSYSQTGPGGIGNSSSNIVWLDASRLSLSNNDLVQTWTELSGNGNNAAQSTTTSRPTFKTNQINGLPTIEFDGVNDLLNFNSNITASAITTFIVYKRSGGSSLQGLLMMNKHILFSNSGRFSAFYINPNGFDAIAKVNSSFSIVSLTTSAGASGSNITLTNGSSVNTETRGNLVNTPNSKIGTGNQPNDSRYFNGQIAEIIVFDEELGLAKKNIVSQYLASKYNRTPLVSLFSFGNSYGVNVVGIGQESGLANTTARGIDSLQISNPSSLGNGDYLLVGNDGGGFGTTTSVPSGTVERWNQVWKADVTGTPGTVDLEFFLGTNNFSSPSNYGIFIESSDGDFSNGGTTIHTAGRSFNLSTNSIRFTGVNLQDGDHFTLGELSGNITAVASDSWEFPTTWSCNCVPGATDVVSVPSAFTVSVDNVSSVLNLSIESGAGLSFDGSDSLYVHGNLIFESTATLQANDGTISFVSAGSEQTFTNNSGNILELNNLQVNNANGLSLDQGDWGISNNLQVNSGGLDATNANSITLRSTPSGTSQILEGMDNALTGNFIVQRYISPRNADWADLASPVAAATFADWDDDLFISGIGGNDGNSTYGFGGPIFYSVYKYDWWNNVFVEITDVSEIIDPGLGYELFLGDNTNSYFGDTIDVVGLPNSGTIQSSATRIARGWNLLGNPYHSFISYDDINFNSVVPDSYYIFNTNNGSYDFFDGPGKPPIAPSQGFWINKTDRGIVQVQYLESSKVNSNSSSFLRKKHKTDRLKLGISNNKNSFKHHSYISFDAGSTSNIDEKDALYLPSKQENAPAIYSKAINSDDKLVLNSLDPFDQSQVIPLEIYTGIRGNYTIDANEVNNIYENYSCVYLKDKSTKKSIDLSVEQSYTFEADKGTHDRFELIFSNSFVDCEKLLNEENSFSQNFGENLSLRNVFDEWFIDYTLGEELSQVEVRVYNLSGQEVINPVSFVASNAGSYPISGLRPLKGIYLIQVRSKGEFINQKVKL